MKKEANTSTSILGNTHQKKNMWRQKKLANKILVDSVFYKL